MAFITAGMGGGTGTGAAPVIARAAKEQGILTVGVVTKPFHFEGVRRMLTAERGIELLAKNVDTLIVIPNQNLFRVANEKTTFAAAFAMADQVLYSGVASITELMTKEGLINLDFADVRAIMSEMGKAMMGTGEATGEKRAIEAAEAAISNPLLDDVSMRGARGLLISITGGPDLTLYEVDEAATRIREEVDPEANIILGATFDDSLEGTMRVSVVATGLALECRHAAPQPEEVQQPRAVAPGLRLYRQAADPGEEADPAGADGGAPGAEARAGSAAVAQRRSSPRQRCRWRKRPRRRCQSPQPQVAPCHDGGTRPAAHAADRRFPADRAAPDGRPAESDRAYRRACQEDARPVRAPGQRRPRPQGRSRRNPTRTGDADAHQNPRCNRSQQPRHVAAAGEPYRPAARRRSARNSGLPETPGKLI